MNLQYVKRYRMELDLRRWQRQPIDLPIDYRLAAWHPSLIRSHAEVKFQSFRGEVDAHVFPCLSNVEGCEQLMEEIEAREGFVPEATWLAEYVGTGNCENRLSEQFAIHSEYCGTIQAVRTHRGKANIQNIGVSPTHRNRGLGTALILAALLGMQHVGIRRVGLEVTAENDAAVRLYRQLGFRRARTLYKSIDCHPAEVAYSEAAR